MTEYVSEEKNSTYEKVVHTSEATSDAEKHFTDATDGALNESVSIASSEPTTEETTGYDASLTSTTILQTTTEVTVTANPSRKFSSSFSFTYLSLILLVWHTLF